MPYAALTDLLERFREDELVQLTDDAGAGVIGEARIARALTSADGTIDAYLAKTYRLPLAPLPTLVVDLACEIARFKLYRDTPPARVQKGYDAALKTLSEIARGIVKLDAGEEQQEARPGALLVEGADRIFSRERMKGF